MLYSSHDLLFSVSLAVFVAVSVVIAAVRWGHKCEPFSRHLDYYYPAWKALVWCFLSALLLIPCIFRPQELDTLRQVRVMLILSSPFYCAVIMFTYFGKVLKKSWWRKPVYVLGIPFAYIMLTCFAHTLVPGNQTVGFPRTLIFTITGVLTVLYILAFGVAFGMVAHALHRYAKENFSNPEDFPNRYAARIRFLPILHIGISWAGAVIGTREALSLTLLLQSVLNVVFLIGALSPHRARDVEKLETGEQLSDESAPIPEAASAKAPEDELPLSQARGKAILHRLHHLMEEDQVFLDSHLTLASLSRSCGANRTYVSRVMNESLGGFFNYVNRFRLEYANKLKAEHPEMSVDDLAQASGFGTRQSYYNIRRSLKRDLI